MDPFHVPTAQEIEQSHVRFLEVRDFFWRNPETEFIVRMDETPINHWEVIPIRSYDEMVKLRIKLGKTAFGFAGFFWHEGRYCFYYEDHVIFQSQFLDNSAIDYFEVINAYECNLNLIMEEFKRLKVWIQGS